MFFGKKVTGPAEWLLVCLGNYGKQYENTRHNIGFMAAERLIDKRDLRCNRSASCASATRAPPAGTTASRTSSPTSAPMCSRA